MNTMQLLLDMYTEDGHRRDRLVSSPFVSLWANKKPFHYRWCKLKVGMFTLIWLHGPVFRRP
jgi:hypothetical protein